MEDFIGLIPNTDVFLLTLRGITIYLIIVWVCILLWVIKDVTNRTHNVFVHIFAILLALSIFGIFIYLLIRPQKTLFEQLYEEEFKEFMRAEEDGGTEEI